MECVCDDMLEPAFFDECMKKLEINDDKLLDNVTGEVEYEEKYTQTQNK